jgi:hypothetical protein
VTAYCIYFEDIKRIKKNKKEVNKILGEGLGQGITFLEIVTEHQKYKAFEK